MKKILISFLWAIAFVITFLQPALTPSAYAAADQPITRLLLRF